MNIRLKIFYSSLYRHTNTKISTGKSLRQDALFLDHCHHEDSFVKSFEPKRDYPYSKKDLNDLLTAKHPYIR
jgi:hypothetical protein